MHTVASFLTSSAHFGHFLITVEWRLGIKNSAIKPINGNKKHIINQPIGFLPLPFAMYAPKPPNNRATTKINIVTNPFYLIVSGWECIEY